MKGFVAVVTDSSSKQSLNDTNAYCFVVFSFALSFERQVFYNVCRWNCCQCGFKLMCN